MEGLARAGHQVTMISPFKPGRNVENYTMIQIDGVLDVMKGTREVNDTLHFKRSSRLRA